MQLLSLNCAEKNTDVTWGLATNLFFSNEVDSWQNLVALIMSNIFELSIRYHQKGTVPSLFAIQYSSDLLSYDHQI